MMKEIKIKKLIIYGFLMLFLLLIYVFNPYKLEHYGYREKVMAHRVNSLEKLDYSQRFYEGVELDLMYDENKKLYDVNHPPAFSIGLNLDDYLSEIKNKDLKLWLDMKNITKKNVVDAANLLSTLVDKHGLNKKNILVESPEIHLLSHFSDFGFTTSFYLPYYMYKEEPLALESIIDSIKKLQEIYYADGVSADVSNYEILKQHFKNDRKFLWDLHQPYSRRQIAHFKNFRTYIKDPTIEIVLVRVGLPIGNR